jgi:glucose/mannose-6-phosphate isomerase
MEDAIKNFAEQFGFEPVVKNSENLKTTDSFVVAGMGGSHLSAGILKMYKPAIDMYVHRDYGLPTLSEKRFKNSLYIASSYSGNTEETLDFAEKAKEAGYNLAIISTGGKLIEFAEEHGIPHIVLPNEGVQPRSAVGFSLLALASLVESTDTSGVGVSCEEIKAIGSALSVDDFKSEGESLAEQLEGKVPVIYSSRANLSVAYNWKIKFNETAKIPAFYNTIPELNHNEMTGFDASDGTRDLNAPFAFVFLKDKNDSPKIIKRMEVLERMYEERGFLVVPAPLNGDSVLEKVFNSLILADWTALGLSNIYGTEAEKVPMVEEFKKLIA